MNIILFIIGCICINIGIASILNVISWTEDALNKKVLITSLASMIVAVVCLMIFAANGGF